ncbi:MAG: response regulator [Candidatus Moraniibacteriota bacterium]|nr:MAG: response regulator [Candidatus Moranbacteria bacterium]
MEKILLVEDDEMISEIYQKKLEQVGYKVELAADGNQAEKKIRLGSYDLVLLDLVLPGLDGITILKEISNEGALPLPSPIVIFSNLNDTENQESAFRYGASGFISKSQFNPSEFLKEIERYLREIRERRKNRTLHFSDEERMDALKEKEASLKEKSEIKEEVVEVEEEKGRYILFVEDEEVFVDLFSERLRKEGFRLTVCTSGREALDLINQNKPDLVITDILLPEMPGNELVSLIRKNKETYDLPIIVMSASILDKQEEEVRELGIQGFFLKTHITPSELVEYVREIIPEK